MRNRVAAIFAAIMAFSLVLTACASQSTPQSEDFDWFDTQPWELPDDAVEMRVDKVHDGDSINLTKPDDDWYEQYRLIGIQAPEIQGHRDEECYGPESAEFLKDLIPVGSTVYIQQDISDKDPNGRFLRHVFVEDGDSGSYYLLSEVMVRGGYARAREYPPDDLYSDVLNEAQEYAWENPQHMWTCNEWKHLIDD